MGWLRSIGRRRERRAAVSGQGACLLAVALAVFAMAAAHEAKVCDPDCYGGDLRTYEPGHPWTSYAFSWQWEAQWALALIALLAAAASAFAETRPRLHRCVTALRGVAVAGATAWLAWRLLEPAMPT